MTWHKVMRSADDVGRLTAQFQKLSLDKSHGFKELPPELLSLILSPLSPEECFVLRSVDTFFRKKVVCLHSSIAKNVFRSITQNTLGAIEEELTPEVRREMTSLDLRFFYAEPDLLSRLGKLFPSVTSLQTTSFPTQTAGFLQKILRTIFKRDNPKAVFSFSKLQQLEVYGATDEWLRRLEHTSVERLIIVWTKGLQGVHFARFPQTLKKFHCRDGSFNDEAVTKLQHVEELDISRNDQITGTCFAKLSPTLKKLICTHTSLTDAAISHLKDHPALEELDITHNPNIRGSFFKNLPKTLKKLTCDYCNLTDEAISYLQHLSLEELTISNNRHITGVTFCDLKPTLRKLICRQCDGLSDTSIYNMQHLVKLEELDIGWCEAITGATFGFLPPAITKLICFGCKLTDATLLLLQGLPLVVLEIGNTEVTGATFGDLPPTLQEFCCFGSELTDETVSSMRHLKALVQLDISRNPGLTGATFATAFPLTLKKLAWRRSSLTDAHIARLGCFTLLEELDLTENEDHRITGRTFSQVSPTLKSFRWYLGRVTEEALFYLGHFTRLEKLDLSQMQSSITGACFAAFPESLRELEIGWNHGVTDESISLLKRLRNLVRLDLSTASYSLSTASYCARQITGKTFRDLPLSLKEVQLDWDLIQSANAWVLKERLVDLYSERRKHV